MPSLFVGHGSPMNVLDENNIFNQGFLKIASTIPKPKAILMISAHWWTSTLQAQSAENPPLIYDFYGFPEDLYRVQYSAVGSPALAQRLQALLGDALILNPERGYDHGMWTVLKYVYPAADIPVVQLSLDCTKSPNWHWEIAQKLRPLRDEGILIMGSGGIVHNLGAINWDYINQAGAGYDWAFAFENAICEAILNNQPDVLINYENLGQVAKLSVPTPEHYLPLLYAVGVRDNHDKITLFNHALVGGSLSMTSVLIA